MHTIIYKMDTLRKRLKSLFLLVNVYIMGKFMEFEILLNKKITSGKIWVVKNLHIIFRRII